MSFLKAISPIDGRYHSKVIKYENYFSEFALIKYRLLVELEYFIWLGEKLNWNKKVELELFKTKILKRFDEKEALQIKNIEKITNHDVKAVEYYIKDNLPQELLDYKEFIHFGLTSQDINNTAIPLSQKEAEEDVFFIDLEKPLTKLEELSHLWKNVSMLARTHGQAASPTKLGKEISVFLVRLQNQISVLKSIPHCAKFGGATGNFNAHYFTYPQIDWHEFGNAFINSLKIKRTFPTTQIEPYDSLAARLQAISRINTIFIDLCRDFWTYISMDYFGQKLIDGEVGSSAMPHKVNPIDFENAEGNLGIANALAQHLANKLPISRLQRDLTDSTVLRNLGSIYAYSSIAYQSLEKGLQKITLNPSKIEEDLNNNWAVLAEAIQSILRSINYPNPYESLKTLTRKNEKITQQTLHHFINELEVDQEIKEKLLNLSPSNYTGQ